MITRRGASDRGGRRVAWASGALAAGLIAAALALTAMALRGPAPARTLQDRVRDVASELRCPTCQDLSVADSPAPLAGEMRAKIAAGLRADRSPEQIRQSFVDAYGTWILLSPPARGIGLVAWVLPALMFAGGLVVGGMAVRRWTRDRRPTRATAGAEVSPLSPADRRLLERALADSRAKGGDGR
jgi:cytochrome c-type biogenesis protein CcmH